jgi:hypothetical protein
VALFNFGTSSGGDDLALRTIRSYGDNPIPLFRFVCKNRIHAKRSAHYFSLRRPFSQPPKRSLGFGTELDRKFGHCKKFFSTRDAEPPNRRTVSRVMVAGADENNLSLTLSTLRARQMQFVCMAFVWVVVVDRQKTFWSKGWGGVRHESTSGFINAPHAKSANKVRKHVAQQERIVL